MLKEQAEGIRKLLAIVNGLNDTVATPVVDCAEAREVARDAQVKVDKYFRLSKKMQIP